MKKRLILAAALIGTAAQLGVFAEPSVPGGALDRPFTENRTLYYVEYGGNEIPDISAEGYTTERKAEEFFIPGSPLTTKNVTTLRNTQTNKRYRFVFTKNASSVDVKSVSVSDKGVLSITGGFSGEQKLFILKTKERFSEEAWKYEDIDNEHMEEKVLNVINLLPEDVSGDIIAQYQFPDSAPSGTYGVLIINADGEDVFYDPAVSYTSAEDLKDILNGYNEICQKEKNAENIKELMDYTDEYNRYLYLDTTEYQKLGDEAKKRAAGAMFGRTYSDNPELSKAFLTAVAAAWNYDGKDLSEILADHNDVIDLELYNEYSALKSKAKVAEKTKNASDIASFRTAFNNAVALSVLSEAKDPEDLEDIMDDMKDYLGIDSAVYRKYTSNKEKCIRALIGNSFSDTGDIEKIINSATEQGNQNGGGSSSNGSSRTKSSSGSNSAGVSAGYKVPVSSTEKEPESEIKETKAFPFTDCDDFQWAFDAIEHMYKNKIINGKSDTLFCPKDKITREEFVKIIVNGFDLIGTNHAKFSDVSDGAWYKEFIDAAFSQGIINGISEDEFGVGRNITREDMAVIIWRAVEKTSFPLDIEIDQTAELSDLDEVSDYAKGAVEALIAKGAISGSGGKFYPKNEATRAEAAKMIYQIIKIR